MHCLLKKSFGMKSWKNLCALALGLILSAISYGNNIQVTNLSLTGQNTTSDTKLIKFDLAWENSWRTSAAPYNWDAAWVFAKYRLTSGSTWHHATLSSSSLDHSAASGSTIDAVSDGVGAFVYRDVDGSGSNAFANMQLMWDYGADGLLDQDSVEICIFAIEMVYVTSGNFYIGDGNSSTTSAAAFELIPNLNSYVPITNALSASFETNSGVDDNPLRVVGIRVDGDGGIDSDNDGTIDEPNFPVGYDAFYCMKYEISQGQFVEFLNHLNSGQSNIAQATTAARLNITGSGNTWGTNVPNRPHGAGYLAIVAYLDWSGLRPMTETEYEKACRGPEIPIYHEYPWGNTNIHNLAYSIGFDGSESENITNIGVGTGNAVYNTTHSSGVVRCGAFAASSPFHTKEETGATYYGIMEMAGNVREVVVTLGDIDGRSFDGTHGDGEVSTSGYSNEAGWPGFDGTYIDGSPASGWGYRGGGENNAIAQLYVSDRSYMNTHSAVSTRSYEGGRGVRTAP